ncbi:MAG TPA: M48 family metallopeptidase [Saprospiraceae bacterium]|jgi:predicted Zn-dependent protease|nr:M48 family metallopeptidase [Saprospiraceae bacterium]HRN34821.1 M48 family metallopeptidase [Saprospiraceae bacterium]HRP85371.1 M48 family metallopeptidase [Saprospiraceae bacterium]
MKRLFVIFSALMASMLFWQCKSFLADANNLNAFTVEQDKQLGDQVAAEIASKPKEYPLLPEKGNEKIYNYIRGLTNSIIQSGKVKYRDQFNWETHIIKDDKTLNAFCTPGGKIYVYTGLIKFLDSEDQLMGVLGHEIAHADCRHSTEQLTKQYGIVFLADALLGNKAAIGQIAKTIVGTLAGLTFSRANESEADAKSVEYLCSTSLNAAGAAGFFKKIEGQSQPPTWLSTHPNPANRVANIEKKATDLGCSGKQTFASTYQQMKQLL